MDFIVRYLWLLKSQKYQPLKTYFIEMARRDLIRMHVLVLCRKFELILTNNFSSYGHFKNEPISDKYPVL